MYITYELIVKYLLFQEEKIDNLSINFYAPDECTPSIFAGHFII